MAMLTRIFPSLLTTTSRFNAISGKMLSSSLFHSFSNESATQMNPGGLFSISVRTHIRNHFPRPSERKRVKRHGWKTRMSTPEGRRVIMNRMLKGRHVYTH